MKLKNVLIVYTNPTTREYKATMEIVKNILKKYGLNFHLANRDRLRKSQFQNKELVIAVGGDGTFLRAAQFIQNQPIFGVNADVKNKEGFFTSSDKNDFELKLRKIIRNEVNIRKFPRLEACINNKKINTLALNEFYIGPKKSYHAAKYVVEIDGKKERQKSGGILVTTPAGSYAWASACSNKRLALDSKNYQFIVREPYEGTIFKNYKLRNVLLSRSQKVKIISEMLDGILIADSVGKEFSFKIGCQAMIKLSANYLNIIWFK